MPHYTYMRVQLGRCDCFHWPGSGLHSRDSFRPVDLCGGTAASSCPDDHDAARPHRGSSRIARQIRQKWAPTFPQTRVRGTIKSLGSFPIHYERLLDPFL